MKKIPLNIGRWPSTAKPVTQFAFVDNADFALVEPYRWSTAQFGNTTYARTQIRRDGKTTTLSMHRLILGVTDRSVLIDHRDRNGLNNQRRNLRFSNKSQNAMNSPGHRDRKSKYKGVSFETFTGKWLVQLTLNGKRVFKQRFTSEIAAGKAYRKAARLFHQ